MTEELPEGWVRSPLGLVTVPVRKVDPAATGRQAFRYIDIGSVDPTSHTVADLDHISVAEAPQRARQPVAEGDVLFSTVRPYLRKIAFIDASLDGEIASTGFCVLRSGGALDPRFLFHLAQSDAFVNAVVAKQRGVSYPAVRDEDLRNIEIDIPPLAEQRRIVAALDEQLPRLQAADAGFRHGVDRVRLAEASLLNAAVGGQFVAGSGESVEDLLIRIDTSRRSKKPPLRAVPVPGYRLPEGWQIRSLDALSDDAGYGTSTKCAYDGEGAAVLRIPNVQGGAVSLQDLKHALDGGVDLSGLYLEPGDLLFVRTNGSLDLIGRAAVVHEALRAAFASYLIRYRLVPDGVDPRWVRAVVSSPKWRQLIESQAASTAGQHNVNLKILGSLPIPVPPRGEQAAILDALDDKLRGLKRLSGIIGDVSRKSDGLRRALLASAFGGRLVPQDPGDEPAIAMLEPSPAPPPPTRPVPAGIQEELPL